MVSYTTTFLAAANLIAIAQAAPAYSVCQVVVNVYKGDPIWVPNSAASTSAVWSVWDPKETTTTVTTDSWSVWDPAYTSTTTTDVWSTWDPAYTSTTTSSDDWASWTTSSSSSTTWSHPYPTTSSSSSSSTTWSHPYPTSSTTWSGPVTTTSASTTTYSSTTTTSTTTTTTTTPPAAATCSSGNYNFEASPAGSCGCEFSIECNMHAAYDANTKFWEENSGSQVDSLEACVEQCNNNSACQATVWSAQDPSDTQDYKRCWQISGLGATQSTGFGQISRKGSCSGSCSGSYSG